MSDRPTPETDAAWKEGNAIREWTCRKLERERDEARGLCRELCDLVAYGLGQSGEPWSIDAMRQATTAIQNAKSLEETK